MRRRTFLKGAAAALVAGPLARGLSFAEEERKRPNVILILADDLSAKELACYGGTGISTPTLDAMAAEGIMFRTAWTSPICGPSRALLRTGLYACRTGYYHNNIIPRVPTYRTHLEIGHAMRNAGYATAAYGKLHDGGDPKDYGYDEYCCTLHWDGYDGSPQSANEGKGMYSIQWYWHPGLVANGKGVPTTDADFGPDIEVDRMLDFIERKKAEPFFVFWATNLPHMERRPGAKRWNYTDVPELDSEGRKTGRRVKGSLKADVEYIDHLIKRIRSRLAELGLLDNTIIVFTSDNGTAGYGKGKLDSEKGPRVPFIVSCPGLVRKTGPSDALIDFSDVLPTVADLAGYELPATCKPDGRSFAPLLLGGEYRPREYIFAQLGDARWVRDRRWLLDGSGRLWDCGSSRDEWKGYKDVTGSAGPEALAARKRLEDFSKQYPERQK